MGVGAVAEVMARYVTIDTVDKVYWGIIHSWVNFIMVPGAWHPVYVSLPGQSQSFVHGQLMLLEVTRPLMIGSWDSCLTVQIRVYMGICMGVGESGTDGLKFGPNGGEFGVDLVALVN